MSVFFKAIISKLKTTVLLVRAKLHQLRLTKQNVIRHVEYVFVLKANDETVSRSY